MLCDRCGYGHYHHPCPIGTVAVLNLYIKDAPYINDSIFVPFISNGYTITSTTILGIFFGRYLVKP